MAKKLLFILCFLFLSVNIVNAQSKSDDFIMRIKSLGKTPDGFKIIAPSIKFGHGLNHIAYCAYKDVNHKIIRFDDTTLPGIYHAVKPGYPTFNPDGNWLAYIVYTGNIGQNAFVVVNGEKGPVFNNADHFIFSKDGLRYAYRAVKGKKQCVVVDGVQGPYYDGIPIENNFLFSPDSKHFTYVGLKHNRCIVIHDGIEENNDFEFIKDVVYSTDSNHLAYKARIEKKGNIENWCVVYDGVPGTVYGRIFDLVFSFDSKHLVFPAAKNNRMVLVDNGKEISESNVASVGLPAFSYDSRTYAYAYSKHNKWYMVINGERSSAYESLGKFLYSYDSKRYAYFAKDNGKWFCVVDGNRNTTGFENGTGAFIFSADSNHYAYAGIYSNGSSIVYDGTSGPVYESIGQPYFSYDSTHVVYRARRKKDGKWQTVLDGRISPTAYNAIGEYYFSNDSRHLAYKALINLKKSVVVVDGKEQCSEHHFNIISGPTYSPDFKHIAYYARAGKNAWKIIVDGIIIPGTYAGFMKGIPIVFDTPTRFHTIGFRLPGPEFVRIEIDIPESSSLKTSITGMSIK